MSGKRAFHGGDTARASQQFGEPAAGWLDLSTGINPNPYPRVELSPGALSGLPQDRQMTALAACARRTYGLPEEAGLVAAPGTQALLQVLPTLWQNLRVAVLGPTYEEHAVTWEAMGHDVAEVASIGDAGDADVLVVVNPNNPDGRLFSRDRIEAIYGESTRRGGVLVIDEAFADVTPAASSAGLAGRDGLVVLRSFGKFFGLAGLRLGFAATTPELAGRLAERLGPWAVSGPALEIGTRALSDQSWITGARTALAEARERLDLILEEAGLRILGGTDLFRLVACDDAGALYRRLGEAGILVRRFDRHPAWLRFGLPGDETGFQRLEAALMPDAAARSTM